MQKFISKYALAAHLAFVSVAPLFFTPTVVLWLSALALVWVLLEPSCLNVERLHEARFRVSRQIARDPLLWVVLVLVVLAGARALNGGVRLSYDAEGMIWKLVPPAWEHFPGCAEGHGYVEFSTLVAMGVVLMGCRHALGRSARAAYLLAAGFLSGGGVVLFLMQAAMGAEAGDGLARAACALTDAMFVGMPFALYLLVSTAAALAVLERGWMRLMPLVFVAIAGNAAGAFLFLPAWDALIWASAEVVFFLYAFVYARLRLSGSAELKFSVLWVASLALATLLVMSAFPDALLMEKVAPWLSGAFWPESVEALRSALSDLAQRVWTAEPWLGTGLGSFAFDIRFNATAADWSVIPADQASALNGYWQLLAERGIVGAVFYAVPLGFLLFAAVRSAVAAVRQKAFPTGVSPLGYVVLAAVLVQGVYDVSSLMPNVACATAAVLAVSAKAFQKESSHG